MARQEKATLEARIIVCLKDGGRVKSESVKAWMEEYKMGKEEVLARIKDCKEELKQKRIEEARKLFLEKNCVFRYKDTEFVINPAFVPDRMAIVWRNLDKNAIYYAIKNSDGSIKIGAVSAVSDKSKKAKFNKALVQANRAKTLALLSELTKGLNFESYLEVCKAYKNWKSIDCSGALKAVPMGEAIKLEEEKEEKAA